MFSNRKNCGDAHGQGEQWEHEPKYKRFANLWVDIFRGNVSDGDDQHSDWR